LPITAGRVHFIRRVSAEGEISFWGERWQVSRRLAHQYVWATVVSHCQRLEVYHRRSEHETVRLIKRYPYEIAGPVRQLRAEFKRLHRHGQGKSTMS
jgi:hypothetical protein